MRAWCKLHPQAVWFACLLLNSEAFFRADTRSCEYELDDTRCVLLQTFVQVALSNEFIKASTANTEKHMLTHSARTFVPVSRMCELQLQATCAYPDSSIWSIQDWFAPLIDDGMIVWWRDGNGPNTIADMHQWGCYSFLIADLFTGVWLTLV